MKLIGEGGTQERGVGGAEPPSVTAPPPDQEAYQRHGGGDDRHHGDGDPAHLALSQTQAEGLLGFWRNPGKLFTVD